MIYYKRNGEVIEKYQIDFDKEEIEKLKNQIINNCSYIRHEEYDSDYSPRFTNEIIRNFTYTDTGRKKEYFEETRDIYHYKYDEYIPPKLVELIDKLLNGDSSAIDKIYNYDIPPINYLEDRIKLEIEELNEIEDITKKINRLHEIEKLLNAQKLNENQQSIESYYNRLLKLISFKLIDSLSISELDRINCFFEIDISSIVKISDFKELSPVKVLKK